VVVVQVVVGLLQGPEEALTESMVAVLEVRKLAVVLGMAQGLLAKEDTKMEMAVAAAAAGTEEVLHTTTTEEEEDLPTSVA